MSVESKPIAKEQSGCDSFFAPYDAAWSEGNILSDTPVRIGEPMDFPDGFPIELFNHSYCIVTRDLFASSGQDIAYTAHGRLDGFGWDDLLHDMLEQQVRSTIMKPIIDDVRRIWPNTPFHGRFELRAGRAGVGQDLDDGIRRTHTDAYSDALRPEAPVLERGVFYTVSFDRSPTVWWSKGVIPRMSNRRYAFDDSETQVYESGQIVRGILGHTLHAAAPLNKCSTGLIGQFVRVTVAPGEGPDVLQ